ncbi:hypothetical protein IKN40_08890 [bacterium]|nr:hypothetical protein [Clostridia bacterium]MBR4617971.1 hypothetical protein [Bacilli bacterium]MBR6908535.1 hypothetical protein [bacterium]
MTNVLGNDLKIVYVVNYYIYNDKDTAHTYIFDDESEADKFKEYLEDVCKEKSIPINIDSSVTLITSFNNAVTSFSEQIWDEDEEI